MRRRIRVRLEALIVAGLTLLAAAPALAQPFATPAKQALLYDVENHAVLLSKDASKTFAPASLAKLMTLAVVFDEIKAGRLSLDQTFPISEHAWRTGGGPARVSAMFAALNSQVSVRDLLRGVCIVVGNDAAIALAEGIAGSEGAFANRMNALARKIGLQDSHFVNPTGLPEAGQKTSARDLLRVARYLIEGHSELYKTFSEPDLDWSHIKQRNRNPLIPSMQGVDGLLTGTNDEGNLYVGSAMRDGRRLIVVVTGLPTDKEREDAARALLTYGFEGFVERKLFDAGQVVANARVFGGRVSHVQLVTPVPVHVLMPREGDSTLTAKVQYTGPLQAPIQGGSDVATLKVWRDGILQREIPVRANASVARGALWQRAFDSVWELGRSGVHAAVKKVMDKVLPKSLPQS